MKRLLLLALVSALSLLAVTPTVTNTSAALSATDKVLKVLSAEGMHPMMTVAIDNELVLVCSVNSAKKTANICKWGRGVSGTTPATHDSGSRVYFNPNLTKGPGGIFDLGTAIPPTANLPVWKLHIIAGVANGVGGCATANGCWSVDGAAPVAQSAGLTQTLVLFPLAVAQVVDGVLIKTDAACTGTTTATLGLGAATGTTTLYSGSAYDIKAAVSNTNFLNTDQLRKQTWVADNVQALITTTVENVDAIADTCSIRIWVKTSILP